MSDIALPQSAAGGEPGRPDLDRSGHPATLPVFVLLLVAGLGFAVYGLASDIGAAGTQPVAIGAFVLLGLALLIALGFEFVNGFHDTANAVATVIYTHSLPPAVAVIWSGAWNFLGVMVSTGAVAYSIITLLPVELILQVGSAGGYAMIFALLLAAIIWNLGTWALGLPNSSSHALIGSVMGVGLANQLLAPAGVHTSGVDWGQAWGVFRALLVSPLMGFVFAALLLLVMKVVVRSKTLYTSPEGNKPPPLWIRSLLVLTCTGVSFAHGGNDGQKGMGLIMLILIGAAPTAYALNRAMPDSAMPAFVELSAQAGTIFHTHAGTLALPPAEQARATVGEALRSHVLTAAPTQAALAALAGDIAGEVRDHGSLRQVPAAATPNIRNDMYLAADAIRLSLSQGSYSAGETQVLKSYQSSLYAATRFIPTWVKVAVAVAVALGLGTMVGWKRIVVTVGERIGKQHLTYAQGASAELIAAATIGAAEVYGLPVSTTHVLSSGVAGAMAANGSGLQWSTVRNMALAWVMTLPAAIVLSGTLYALFRAVF